MSKEPWELEESDDCPTGCGGKLGFEPVEHCTCHVSPPCHACTTNPLMCSACYWTEADSVEAK